MPQLGQRLGQLHAEPMQLQIVPVRVVLEQTGGHLRDLRSHRDKVECHDVGSLECRQIAIAEEVRQAQVPSPRLPREGVAVQLRSRVDDIGSGTEDDEIVALAVARPIPIDDGELRDRVGLDAVQPQPQPRPALSFDQFLVRRSVPGSSSIPTGP